MLCRWRAVGVSLGSACAVGMWCCQQVYTRGSALVIGLKQGTASSAVANITTVKIGCAKKLCFRLVDVWAALWHN